MQGILKTLVLAGGLSAILFYFVTMKQQKLEIDIKHDQTEFSRDWNEFDVRNGFGDGKTAKARAEEAERELKAMAAEEKAAQKRSDDFMADFDSAIEEVGKTRKAAK